jgi:hypothetical protein
LNISLQQDRNRKTGKAIFRIQIHGLVGRWFVGGGGGDEGASNTLIPNSNTSYLKSTSSPSHAFPAKPGRYRYLHFKQLKKKTGRALKRQYHVMYFSVSIGKLETGSPLYLYNINKIRWAQ